MRAAREMGIRTFALWRLGSEDRSLWSIWDNPGAPDAEQKLHIVPFGQDVDTEGSGEILSIESKPSLGQRKTTLDPDSGLVVSQQMTVLPEPYQLRQLGSQVGKVALSFGDGPGPAATPQILDILKKKNAPATFFLIGSQAQKYSGLARHIDDAGDSIGIHSLAHRDITEISNR